MRILFLTNFYPPASRGGFERWCQEVAAGLLSRGHNLVVLTSNFRTRAVDQDEPHWVRRELHLEMDFASLRNGFQFFISRDKQRAENRFVLRRTIDELKPDATLIWGMWNLSRQLPVLVEELMPSRVVYYMGDYWPTLPSQLEMYWQAPPRNWATSIPKNLLKPAAMRLLNREVEPNIEFKRVVFPTRFMRDDLMRKGLSASDSRIIYGAIDTEPYCYQNGVSKKQESDSLNLLFVGRLDREKGPHTAIKALAYLVNRYNTVSFTLTIVGDGEPEFKKYLRELALKEKVDSYVIFRGSLPSDKLPALYHEADIFLFTSIWPEPFGRVIIEAMASGVPVVGTASGGAAEIMVENENALIFTQDDPASLAEQVERLIDDPSLRNRLALNGRETAVQKFDIGRMAEEIEAYLAALTT